MMPDLPISLLPYVGNTGYTDNDLLVVVNYQLPSGTTSNTTVLQHKEWILSGLTDSSITGFTYDDANTFSIQTNSGSPFNATINDVTGLTVNGVLTITATTDQTFGVINFGSDPFIHSYGTGNTYVGKFAGSFSGNGSDNTGIGEFSLDNLDNGDDNTGLGSLTLTDLTGGTFNTAIGAGSLQNLIVGDNNTGLGVGSNALLQSGSGNTSIGFQSLYNNLSGSSNVALGYKAGWNETGSNRLHISNTDTNTLIYGEFDNQRVGINTTLPTNMFHVAGSIDPVRFEGLQLSSDTRVVTTDNNGVLHYLNVSDITGATSTDTYITGFTYSANTFYIYDNSGTTLDATINEVTGLTINGNLNVTGDTSLNNLTANTITATTISGGTLYGDGSNLTGIQSQNIYNTDGILTANRIVDLSGNTLSLRRSSNFNDSLLNGLDTSGNTLFEIRSQYRQQRPATLFPFDPFPNQPAPMIFIGLNSGKNVVNNNITGGTNTAIGSNALSALTTGSVNTAIGGFALASLSASSFNIGIGEVVAPRFVGGTGATGDDNIFIGNGNSLQKINGRDNVIIGCNAFQDNITGDRNVVIGRNAGRTNANGSSNIFIGYDAGRNETGSNLLYIENSSSASPLIYGDFTNDLLRFNSKVGVNVLPNTYQFDVNGTAIIRGYLYLQPTTPSNTGVIINQNSNDGSLVWGGSNLNLNSSFASTNIIISPTGTYNSMSGFGNTIIGRSAGSTLTSGNGNTLIGRNAGLGLTTGTGNIIIGRGDANNLPSSTSQSIHIVTDYRNNDASNMPSGIYAFIGGGFGGAVSIQDFYFGGMPFTPDTTASTISTLNFHAPSGLGTDLPGGSFRINGGRGTGNGTPGDVIFGTSTSGASSSALQTLTSRWWVKGSTGNLGNLSSPTNRLHVTATTNPVRFEGLQSGTTDTRILSTDSTGVIRYRNFSDFTGDYLPLSGGTVTGDTIFQSGLTATTISATTYFNLPIDPDTYVTGFTYSANTFYIYDNSGTTFDATINDVTGLTVNGNLSVTGNTTLNNLTASTISATTYVNLPFNYYITGSTPTGVVLNYGDRWYNTNNGIELVWITDGNSDQWVQPAYNTIPQAYNNVLVTSGITVSSATLSMNVNYYGVNYNGDVDLILPSPVGYDGYNMNIKDEGGYAGTTRIRITPSSGTIDGNPYVDMNINYMSLHVVARNNNWWII